MSRICLFVLFLDIAVRFSDCENRENNIDCTESTPGSNATHLTTGEKKLVDAINGIEDFKRNDMKEEGFFSNVFKKISNYLDINAIFPGTLWCGSGNIAENDTDLGSFNKTDACCRMHDHCNNTILSGKTKANLKNNSIFTRSACHCDHDFYNCLKNVSTLTSGSIGKTFFNILQPQCLECTCPTKNCQINNSNNCCTKYKWVDNLKF